VLRHEEARRLRLVWLQLLLRLEPRLLLLQGRRRRRRRL
jgi:hypothetical protein